MSVLPPPDADQLAASGRLARRIAARIEAAGGWIGFDAWMEQALYEPGLGYYSGGSRKFGAAGDFVTAPETSPLFGRGLAAQLAQWFASDLPPTVFEFGAGSGALAASILEALAGEPALRYRIVELSATLRERQRATIAARVPALLERVEWLDALPGRLEGVVLANELLDAMPVRLFRLCAHEVRERGVVRSTGGTRDFAFEDRLADPAFAAAVRSALADSGWAARGGWPEGYASELGEQAAAWVETVGRRLAHGALLLIDYGFPRAEFYHPQRAEGTLICHYRHRSHDDPLWLPGGQDISAHVDFTAVARAARAAGLVPLGYASQAAFLIGCGLPELAMQEAPQDPLDWARHAQAVQRLLSEAEMGELFKAIAFGRAVPDDAIGFAGRDRRATLEGSSPA